MRITQVSIVIALASFARCGTLYESDFSTTSLSPFSACNFKASSYAQSTGSLAEFFFDESGFDGTRNDKGTELCVFEPGTSTNVKQMKKEGWQGFDLYLPSPEFPTDKSTIIAQQFCPGGCSSWCGTLGVVNNDLVVEHMDTCGNPTVQTILSNIPRNNWHRVVVHMKVSQAGNGEYEVWWEGECIYAVKNINIGFGTWDNSTDTLTSGWYFKNGIYAFGERQFFSSNVLLRMLYLQ